MRSRVVVLQVPPFDSHRALGGAEVIAASIVNALIVEYQVTVLCSHDESGPEALHLSPYLRVVRGFPLDNHVRRDGCIRPSLTAEARQELGRADLVISIERALLDSPPLPRIVVLGGVGYRHTLDVIGHGAWDRLVVPSWFVARQVADRRQTTSGVVVIPNGIDTRLFSPTGRSRPGNRLMLLLPSRPVIDKGIRSALRLTAALRQVGLPAVLVCLDQPDGLDGAGVMADLRVEARPWVDIRPWQPRSQMPALYAEADLTLCLSEVAEGFGLVAAESIACGTPVLALPAGFLAEMLPPNHGLHLVSADEDPRAWIPAVLDATTNGRAHSLSRGRPAIETHYASHRMSDQFVRLVQSMLTGRNSSGDEANASLQLPSGHNIGS